VTDGKPHDELHESTGAYVVGALTDEDRAAFEAHLATCGPCREEVRAFREVVRGLDLAVEQHAPPAALRERVLAGTARPAVARVDAPAARRVSPAYWMAAAAAAAAVLVGVYAATLRGRVQSLEDELLVLRSETSTLRRDLEQARTRTAIAERMTFVLAANDMRRVDLTGQVAAPSAAGRALWSPSSGLIFSADLPPAPADRVYQLWVVTATGPVSAGLLTETPQGGLALVSGAIEAGDPPALAVTLEPAGGVPAPTGPMYLVGKI
jgi:anti-sigma-K factor RskA